MANLTHIIIFSFAGGVLSLFGGFILLGNRKIAQHLAILAAPFAAGALLAAAFLDLLPDAIEQGDAETALLWALAGMLTFFLLERFLRFFHHHHEHRDSRPAIALVIIGDTIHNAIDGAVIATAFLVSIPTGIVATVAVAAHEIPQEIGDFGLLLKLGVSRPKVVLVNFMSALATVFVACTTFLVGDFLPLMPMLGLTAGFFIYIAASDIIPTIHMSTRRRFAYLEAVILVLGVVMIGTMSRLVHSYLTESLPEHQHNETTEIHHHDEAENLQ